MNKKDTNVNKIDSLMVLSEISKLSEVLNRVSDKFYKKFQLTQLQFKTLCILYLNDNEGITLSNLGKKLDITKPSVTSLVDRMISGGLIERFPDKSDRRIIRAVITDKGREIVSNALPDNEAFSLSVLDFLTEEQKENLYELIIKIKQELIAKFLKD